MPPNSSASAQMVPAGDDDAVRPQDSDIQDMQAAKDEELAIIFREMRRASDQSFEQLAARLKTQPDVLRTLEEGNISALPPWNETSRIVTEYTALLNLDSRPVLRRLEVRLAGKSPGSGERPSPGPAAPSQAPGAPVTQADQTRRSPAMPNPASAASGATTRPGPPGPPGNDAAQAAAPAPAAPSQLRQAPPATPAGERPLASSAGKARKQGITGGAIITWLLLLLVFGVMGLGVRHAVQNPQAVWAAVDALPDPAPRIARSIWELVRPSSDAPEPAAVPDPESQKSDRLPDATPPQGN